MFQYTHPGIKPRAKGQHYDKRLLPMLEESSHRGVPASATCQLVGTSEAYQGWSPGKSPCWLYEVTLANGTVVPCYSFSGGSHMGNGYMICQSLAHKSYVPKKSLAKVV